MIDKEWIFKVLDIVPVLLFTTFSVMTELLSYDLSLIELHKLCHMIV